MLLLEEWTTYYTFPHHCMLRHFFLHQELMSFAEDYSFEFRLLTGEVLKLNQDGSFSIDGSTCSGDVYTGVADC